MARGVSGRMLCPGMFCSLKVSILEGDVVSRASTGIIVDLAWKPGNPKP